ncbi:MAG TPA: SDR family oxidoreductase [Steroidobacteraceae bacterium]|nr:SDR family oxidoreductase [Steroidobacteraceae bacterium]
MDLGIRGRKALVNGGSAGMGKEAALALAREGVELVISARGEARLRATAAEIAAETGVRVTPVVADHSRQEGLGRILAACPAPDILVATCSPPPMTEDYRQIDDAQWRASLDTGLLSPVHFMHAVLEGMVSRGWGRIVNIATIAAKFPLELRILSGAPRAALINYAGAVALRVVQHGVTINNVLPGMFHTAFTQEQLTARARANGTTYEDEVAKFAADFRIAARRFGDSRDVGALVAWLCSQYAGYITGQSIVVDGGATRSTF